MSLLQFLRILAARKAIILAALISCFVVAFAISQMLPPRYQAKARIILDIVKPDPVTGQPMQTQFLRQYVNTQVELIKDYRTAGRVVDKLGWEREPVLIEQYARATDGQGTDMRRWLAQQIIDGTNAGLISSSNILEISFTGQSADAAGRIAELVREEYVNQSLESRREGAGRTADWYRDQADKALRQLTAAEQARSKFARDNGIVLAADNSDLESAKLAQLSSQTAVAASTPSFSAPVQSSPSAAALDNINQQIAQAGGTLGPNHPVYQSLLRQRSVLQAEVARQQAAGGGGGVSAAEAIARSERAYQAQRSRVIAQRDKVDQLNQMRQDIELKREQYLKAAQRSADLRLEADVGETELRILGAPIVPQSPTFPNMPLILGGSIAFGLGLGVVLALLIELIGRRVRSDEDLERAAGAPVFAVVGDRRVPDSWVRKLLTLIDRRAATRRKFAEI